MSKEFFHEFSKVERTVFPYKVSLPSESMRNQEGLRYVFCFWETDQHSNETNQTIGDKSEDVGRLGDLSY